MVVKISLHWFEPELNLVEQIVEVTMFKTTMVKISLKWMGPLVQTNLWSRAFVTAYKIYYGHVATSSIKYNINDMSTFEKK